MPAMGNGTGTAGGNGENLGDGLPLRQETALQDGNTCPTMKEAATGANRDRLKTTNQDLPTMTTKKATRKGRVSTAARGFSAPSVEGQP
jgi:hypothetical protein